MLVLDKTQIKQLCRTVSALAFVFAVILLHLSFSYPCIHIEENAAFETKEMLTHDFELLKGWMKRV
jgi:hypothetical protein